MDLAIAQNQSVSGTAPAAAPARNGGIDAARAGVTLLVVLHHAAITYGATGGWYYKELLPSATPSSRLLLLFVMINQAWFMGMFFLLAGYYTPPSWQRQGTPGFVQARLLRLGLPIVVYAFLLHPLTVGLAATARGHSFIPTVNYLWRHHAFEPGPLWFTEALLIFSATWLLVRLIRPGATARPQPFPPATTVLAAVLLAGVAAFLLRLVWPVGVNVAFLQLGYFASYIILYAAGCRAADARWLEHIPTRQAQGWWWTGLIVLPVFPVVGLLAYRVAWLGGRANGGWNLQAAAYALWEPFVACGVILHLLLWCQRHFPDLHGTMQRLARRAYLIYIIHPPILVATAIAWREVAAPAILKFLVTGSITCVLCYVAAGLLLRVPGVARVA